MFGSLSLRLTDLLGHVYSDSHILAIVMRAKYGARECCMMPYVSHILMLSHVNQHVTKR